MFFLALHIRYNKTGNKPSRKDLEKTPSEGGAHLEGDSKPSHPRLAEIAFPIVALTILAGINILFIVDVELTIRRNNRHQAGEDNVWGFGQVLALLLFVVPLRDAGNAIVLIRRGIQGRFEELFERECKERPVLDELKRRELFLCSGEWRINVVICCRLLPTTESWNWWNGWVRGFQRGSG